MSPGVGSGGSGGGKVETLTVVVDVARTGSGSTRDGTERKGVDAGCRAP